VAPKAADAPEALRPEASLSQPWAASTNAATSRQPEWTSRRSDTRRPPGTPSVGRIAIRIAPRFIGGLASTTRWAYASGKSALHHKGIRALANSHVPLNRIQIVGSAAMCRPPEPTISTRCARSSVQDLAEYSCTPRR
jgi:hypothetical protein